MERMEFVCGLKQFKEYTEAEAFELIFCLESLFRSCSWMTDDRVDYILKNGLRGEYGDFYHVNERTVNGWIHKYYQSHQNDIVRQVLSSNHNKEKEVTQDEIDYWNEVGKQTFRSKFEEAKKSGYVAHIAEWGIYWYNKMVEKGLLKPWEYPVDQIENEIRKELRLIDRFVEESSVSAKTKNKIWKLFILDCVKKKIDLGKMI